MTILPNYCMQKIVFNQILNKDVRESGWVRIKWERDAGQVSKRWVDRMVEDGRQTENK